jgi:phosphoribosylformylglycinamidine synthase
VDLDRERALADVLVAGCRQGLLATAHDLSDGGLALALVESCLRGGTGARIELPPGTDPFVALFSESAGRALVVVTEPATARFTELCTAHALPCTPIGTITGDASLEVSGLGAVPLAELRAAHEATLPRLFD